MFTPLHSLSLSPSPLIPLSLSSTGKQDREGAQAGAGLAIPSANGVSGRGDRVWHLDEELLSGGGASPKPGSPGSPGDQGEGAASSGFVALNLSSGRQDVDSREWVLVERVPDTPPGRSAGAKATSSPSEEEPEILQLAEEGNSGEGGPHRDALAPLVPPPSAAGAPRVERLELSVGPPGSLAPVTPTSPAEALAEGALTQVAGLLSLPGLERCWEKANEVSAFGSFWFITISEIFFF